MNQQRITELRDDIKELLKRFDQLSHLYVLREMFLLWQQTKDRRLDTLEQENKETRAWENQEHTRLAEQVVKSERRIIEKIDGKRQWKVINYLFMKGPPDTPLFQVGVRGPNVALPT
jgi:hypothetical protein